MPMVHSVVLPAFTVAALAAAVSFSSGASGATAARDAMPAAMPAEPAPVGVATASDTAVFAGGCFWGVEAVFESLEGVTDAVSGYAGGSDTSPSYDKVSSGTTGHAESVRVVYDPSRISYDQLLQVFFTVAHDPTELNRQGPDVGTQYRSAVFYRNPRPAGGRRAVYRQAPRRQGVAGQDRDRGERAERVPSGGGVPPELPGAAPDPALHRGERHAQARGAAEAVSRPGASNQLSFLSP